MITIKVEGMMCPHCEARVKNAVLALDFVKSAEVSHQTGTAVVEIEGEHTAQEICAVIEAQGYPASV